MRLHAHNLRRLCAIYINFHINICFSCRWHSVVTANENVHALSTPFQRLVSSAHVETETENANSTAAKLTVDPAPNGPILKHDLQQGRYELCDNVIYL